MNNQPDKGNKLGWAALALSTIITSVWAFWGIIENFHEGWYAEHWWMNVGLMVVQYLSPMLIFMGTALVAVFWPRVGGGLHGLLGFLAVGFFGGFSNAAVWLIIIPMIGLGVMYWFGRPRPRRVAVAIAVGIPLLTLFLAGIGPAIRAAKRIDDGILDARVVVGNGVQLVWAPDGPGWPRVGRDWYEARDVCQHLNEDGQTLSSDPPNIWRLPTVDEAVRSMARHGISSGGIWYPETAAAVYEVTPDKESPLWNVHSQVIYWWTATEIDDVKAYIIVYDGKVWPRSKTFGPAYLGFRCVK